MPTCWRLTTFRVSRWSISEALASRLMTWPAASSSVPTVMAPVTTGRSFTPVMVMVRVLLLVRWPSLTVKGTWMTRTSFAPRDW
ncbi:hypothetical protein D9M69_644220 [compost metagenome]